MSKITFLTKLGTVKGVPCKRIWLTGQKLSDAGFAPGTVYYGGWTQHGLVFSLKPLSGSKEGDRQYTIWAKGDNPQLNIENSRIAEFFGLNGRTHAFVTIEPGVVTITRTKS